MQIDSTVLIDVLRGNKTASKYLSETKQKVFISRIVVMEIIAGCKNKQEIINSLKLIQDFGIEAIEIDEDISALAGKVFEEFFLRFGLGITDAFIAATALVENTKLVTHNLKHFKFIKDLELIVPY
jgi:predicted nucleic acid-binding protein